MEGNLETDNDLGYSRNEVHCANYEGHLGLLLLNMVQNHQALGIV